MHHIADTLTERGWGPATLVLTGIGDVTIGVGGPRIEVDPLTFTLVTVRAGRPSDFGTRRQREYLPVSPWPQRSCHVSTENSRQVPGTPLRTCSP